MDIEEVGRQIVDAALKVHRSLGAGLLESTYQACLMHELRQRGLRVECEVAQPVDYEGMRLEVGYRIDLLVEGCVIVENKACDQVLPVHKAQILTYMRLSHASLGFLINWHTPLIKNGIYRFVL